MGFLNFVLLILFAAIVSIAAQISSGTVNAVFILLILYVFVMQKMVLSLHDSWIEKVKREEEPFNNLISKSEVRHFLRGRLFWRTSIFQSVYYAYDESSVYWFVCGSWILGGFSKKITVYKTTIDGEKLRVIKHIL